MTCVRRNSAPQSVRIWYLSRWLLALLLLGSGKSAQAAIFTVDSAADAVDISPGNGVCADASANCTLRASVMEANALSGADTVTLPAGTYTLTIPGAGENAAATGDLDITADLAIHGAGAAATTIDGGGLDRVFETRGGATVQINSVTLRLGNAGAGDVGGGISNFTGTLTMNSVTVSANTAGLGGGIANESGTITLNGGTVSANRGESAGGIFNHGTMFVNSSLVDRNQAAAGTGRGGGIWNDGGTVTLTNSTVSGNSAVDDGGGLLNTGTLLSLTSCTVSGNSAPSGGGIRNAVNTQLRNTIVANNTGGDCLGNISSVFGHNLSGDASCALAGPGDLNGVNPLLGPLANNGGPTETHALLPGNPAIDGVPVPDCAVNADQRGVPRPSGAACDIGAYETDVRTPTPTSPPTDTATPSPTSTRTPDVTPTPTLPCVPPPAHMVAWWPLDDVAGASTVADIGLPPANNGMPQPGPIVAFPPGGPQSIAGNLITNPADRALYFYGPTTYVEVPSVADFDLANADLTIDAWALIGPAPVTLSAARDAVIVLPVVDKLGPAASSGYAFYVRIEFSCPTCTVPLTTPAASSVEIRIVFSLGSPSGLVSYRSAPIYTGTGTVFPFPMPPSTLTPQSPGWMHVAVSIDRAQGVGKFYYTGAHLATSDFAPAAGVNNAAPMWLGGNRPNAMAAFTEFSLNEIEIFDAALSAAEIHDVGSASGGKCKTPAGGTPTPTPVPIPCIGDCDGDGVVTISELVLMMNIALGNLPVSACFAGDANQDGTIDINEMMAAVNAALLGCPCGFIGPRMCGGACPNPIDVCQPLPDDSGCACRSSEPRLTPTATPTRTATHTVRATPTLTATALARNTPTRTPSRVSTVTPTPTATPTLTLTPEPTVTSTRSPTPCCEVPVSLNISTGQALVGQDDPIWRLTTAPAGTVGGSVPRPATVISPNNGWTTLPGAQWVAADTLCTPTISAECPGGLYSYELCWSQCDSLEAPLVLDVLADNSAAVFLNGIQIGATTAGFTTPTTIPFTDPGPNTVNCLRVDVTNNSHSSGAGTATGMDLSGSLTGCIDLVTPCGSVGPRMCGGACRNPTDVCQPRPDDSGCACQGGAPVLGEPCGNGSVLCTYHEHCGVAGAPLLCNDDTISGGGGCNGDNDCAVFPALPLCVGTNACSSNRFCYGLCP